MTPVQPRRSVPILIICGVLLALPLFAQRDPGRFAWRAERLLHVEQPLPDRYIVVLKDDAVFAMSAKQLPLSVSETARQLTAGYDVRVDRIFGHALRGFSAAMTPATASRLADDQRVAYVEEDGTVHTETSQPSPPWGLDRIDQRALPLRKRFVYLSTGAGVHAYIVDTGIRLTHSQFGGRAVSGFDAVDGGEVTDCNGHGTHVAGTVGGSTYGVAKRVTLVGVRVIGCSNSAPNSWAVAGIDWIAANHVKPAVANMSLGSGPSMAIDDAVRRAIAAGVQFSISAGNSRRDACTQSPSRVQEAMTIGASTSLDRRASYSNYGPCVDWYAPGSGVISAGIESDVATRKLSGTSMSAPHTTGVAALYLQRNPTATPEQVQEALRANTTRGIVGGARNINHHLLFTNY